MVTRVRERVSGPSRQVRDRGVWEGPIPEIVDQCYVRVDFGDNTTNSDDVLLPFTIITHPNTQQVPELPTPPVAVVGSLVLLGLWLHRFRLVGIMRSLGQQL